MNASWRAGVAAVKITPEKLLWMTGFGFRTHPAVGTAQDLWVKALALEDPAGKRAVLLSADICGVTREISERVAGELARRHGLARSAVLINVTHTHSGPVIEGLVPCLREFTEEEKADNRAYREELERRMIRAADEALSALQPADLAWGADSAGFAVNRRNNPEAEVPALRAAGKLRGPVLHDVPVLTARSPDGKLLAVVAAYSCHTTTLKGYEWSGDYAGHAQLEIRRRHPGAAALFLQGCGANINALPRGAAESADYGRQIADAVDRASARPMTPVGGNFASALEEIALPFAHRPAASELEQASRSGSVYERLWSRHLSDQMRREGEIRMSWDYPLQAWRLGNLCWLACAGEVVVDYEIRLRRESGPGLWVLGYCSDVMGYIPSEAVLAEGGYEGNTSMTVFGGPSALQPGLEDRIVAAAHRVLAAVGRGTPSGGRARPPAGPVGL